MNVSKLGNKPLISVVIPLYNKEAHIKRTILSILIQEVNNIEIVVIDDGSTDNGKAIVEAIPDRRIRIISQENMGVSAARNLGISESTSELIAFIDADDQWKPGFIKKILSLRNRFSYAGAFGTSYETIVRGGKTYFPVYKGIPDGWEGILPSYFKASFGMHVLHTSAVAIPKYVFEKVGGFEVGQKLGEDLDMWLRIALSFPIAYSNKSLAIYHQEAVNRTDELAVHVNRLPYLKRAELALKTGSVPDHLKNDLIDYVAIRKIGYAKLFIKLGQSKEGRTVLENIKSKKFAKEMRIWVLLSYIPSIVFDILRFSKWRLNSFIR